MQPTGNDDFYVTNELARRPIPRTSGTSGVVFGRRLGFCSDSILGSLSIRCCSGVGFDDVKNFPSDHSESGTQRLLSYSRIYAFYRSRVSWLQIVKTEYRIYLKECCVIEILLQLVVRMKVFFTFREIF